MVPLTDHPGYLAYPFIGYAFFLAFFNANIAAIPDWQGAPLQRQYAAFQIRGNPASKAWKNCLKTAVCDWKITKNAIVFASPREQPMEVDGLRCWEECSFREEGLYGLSIDKSKRCKNPDMVLLSTLSSRGCYHYDWISTCSFIGV